MDEQIDTGTGVNDGQPESVLGTEEHDGQPSLQDRSVEEPQTGAESTEEIGPEHKSYKEIQASYTKASQKAAELERRIQEYESKFTPYGGADALLQQAQQLVQDPEFTKWAESRNQNTVKDDIYTQFGIDPTQDRETANTVDAVMKIAESVVQKKLEAKDAEHRQQITQIKNEQAQERVRGYLGKLRSTPGYERIDDLREEMMKASDLLAPEKRANPSLEDLQDLYWMAARRTGMFEELQASAYQKRLESKKSKSLDKPSPSTSKAPQTNFNNLKEAFSAAKKLHGVSELKF